MTDEKEFLERPLAVVALIGGIVGTLGTAVAIYTGLAAPAPTGPVGSDAEQRIAECVRSHGLAQAAERRDVGDGRWYYRACVWTAPPGAAADGFTEITLRETAGPGRSEAEGLTVAHLFTTNCRDLELVYLFDNQGTFVPEQPIRLTKGEVRRVEGGSVVVGLLQPGRDQSILLSNGRYQLDSVRCV